MVYGILNQVEVFVCFFAIKPGFRVRNYKLKCLLDNTFNPTRQHAATSFSVSDWIKSVYDANKLKLFP